MKIDSDSKHILFVQKYGRPTWKIKKGKLISGYKSSFPVWIRDFLEVLQRPRKKFNSDLQPNIDEWKLIAVRYSAQQLNNPSFLVLLKINSVKKDVRFKFTDDSF